MTPIPQPIEPEPAKTADELVAVWRAEANRCRQKAREAMRSSTHAKLIGMSQVFDDCAGELEKMKP